MGFFAIVAPRMLKVINKPKKSRKRIKILILNAFPITRKKLSAQPFSSVYDVHLDVPSLCPFEKSTSSFILGDQNKNKKTEKLHEKLVPIHNDIVSCVTAYRMVGVITVIPLDREQPIRKILNFPAAATSDDRVPMPSWPNSPYVNTLTLVYVHKGLTAVIQAAVQYSNKSVYTVKSKVTDVAFKTT
jgi:hypothetical protein